MIIRDTMSYSPSGMLIAKTDTLGNTTTSSYDDADIALVSIKNPLGWQTKYTYDYSVGKPKSATNQNNVTTITDMDAW